MRDYGRVAPRFWIGKTGKKIRALGYEARIVATYLITCPSANMIGMYYLPIVTISHETGVPVDDVRKALHGLAEVGFARYDEASETVWIPEMARVQIDERLKATDKRVHWIVKEMQRLKAAPFVQDFLDRYGDAYNLPRITPEAPLKALGSQEQEKEQEQEQEKEQEQEQEKEKEQDITTPPQSPPSGGAGTLSSSSDRMKLALTPEQLAEIWNAEVPKGFLPRVSVMKGGRSARVVEELRRYPSEAYWRETITEYGRSKFLLGLKNGKGHEGFRADFDWLVCGRKDGVENHVRVHDGKYRDGVAIDADE